MCFSRREWFDELARREREEEELRELLDRERREPHFVDDPDPREPATGPAERDPVVAGR